MARVANGVLTVGAACALLTACGGGGGSSESSTPAPGQSTPGASQSTPSTGGTTATAPVGASPWDATKDAVDAISPNLSQTLLASMTGFFYVDIAAKSGMRLATLPDGTYWEIHSSTSTGTVDTVGAGTYSDAGSAFATNDYVRVTNAGVVSTGSISASYDTTNNALRGTANTSSAAGALSENIAASPYSDYRNPAVLGALSGSWTGETYYGGKSTDLTLVGTTGSAVDTLAGTLPDGCTFTGWAQPYKYGMSTEHVVLVADAKTCSSSTALVAGATYRGIAFVWTDSANGHHAIIGVMTDDRKHGYTWNVFR